MSDYDREIEALEKCIDRMERAENKLIYELRDAQARITELELDNQRLSAQAEMAYQDGVYTGGEAAWMARGDIDS